MAVDNDKKKAVLEESESVKEAEDKKELIAEEEDVEDSSETIEDSEEIESEEEEEDSKPKAKKDPVPAIMIVLIYAIILSAVLYYVVPAAVTPSFGYTLEEFNASLKQSEAAQRVAKQYTTIVPQFKLVDKNSIKEIWSIKGEIAPDDQKRLDARFKPFIKTYAATEELEHILVEANTRSTDGKLTKMCIYCTYDNEHLSMMMVHFGAVLCNFFPGMKYADAISLVMNSTMSSNTEARYTVKDGVAYRIAAENIGGQQTYIKLEIIPAKGLKSEQIDKVINSEAAASETTAAPVESTTAAPAA